MICVLGAFVILFVRLIYLQVITGEELRRLSLNNSIRLQSIDAPRGRVYDRSQSVLVDNRPSFDVSIILRDAAPVEQTIEKLSEYIKIPSADLMATIKNAKGFSSYKPVLLKQDIGRNALAALEAHKYDLPGVAVKVNLRRNYINNQYAAHLLGYLSEINSDELKSGKYEGYRSGDLIGKFGVEKTFENVLRGERGGRQVKVNAKGQVVRVLKTVAATPGHDVYLTIDQDVQKKAEELLEGIVGAVVAMEPTSGRILALTSSPSFDQNFFVGGISRENWTYLITNPFRPMSNRAIQGEYPPGSTYKMITAMAGLQEGVVGVESTYYCPGFYKFGNRVYRCWKKGGHGTVDIIKALEESCDVYFYQVGQALGVDRLAWYAKAGGLGARTGINLDHESSGLIPTAAWKKRRISEPWQEGETLSVAIGQGFNTASPVQMAVLISAVAAGGQRYKPLLLEAVKTFDGRLLHVESPQVVGKLPVDDATLQLVQKGLWQAVNGEHGTARRIRMQDISISGKTGTSQVVSRKKDDEQLPEDQMPAHQRPHAWFVAYAPSDNPKIAVAVVVEHGEHGSGAAAPISKEIIKTYLRGKKSGSRLFARKHESPEPVMVREH
ncbi:MAG: penicillin-binding protein 2 [Deltaproteobacteria bacterium]|nr:penicillin-binding protein 2 [Deltaproteobacteria bacterium]